MHYYHLWKDGAYLTILHRQPYPEYAVDLPNLYKRSIVFFRSLHSLTRLLPSYDLYRKLHKSNDATHSLSIGYRLSTSSGHGKSTEISLGKEVHCMGAALCIDLRF